MFSIFPKKRVMVLFHDVRTLTFREFTHKYERFVSPLAMLVGFTIDSLTLTRIDLLLDNIILLTYLTVAGGIILILNARDRGFLARLKVPAYTGILTFIMQWAFGGLFSGFVVLYSRSAGHITSLPFLLILIALLLGNEFFRSRYTRMTFHVSVYYTALFSYCMVIVPIVLGNLGVGVFLLSGLVSLCAFGVLLGLLWLTVPERVRMSKRMLLLSIGGIYLTVNLLYFVKAIPPIPLGLKEADAYHEVVRVPPSNYELIDEKNSWYESLIGRKTLHIQEGESVFFFSSVFAPTRISSTLYHRWSYKDTRAGEWVVTDTIALTIVGGRDGGYRGFSQKSSLEEGQWKVDVVTGRGELLGRRVFTLIEMTTPPPRTVRIR